MARCQQAPDRPSTGAEQDAGPWEGSFVGSTGARPSDESGPPGRRPKRNLLRRKLGQGRGSGFLWNLLDGRSPGEQDLPPREPATRPGEQDLLPREPATRPREPTRPLRRCKPGQPRQQAYARRIGRTGVPVAGACSAGVAADAVGPTGPSLVRAPHGTAVAIETEIDADGRDGAAPDPDPSSARKPPPVQFIELS
jgi:hypothetical protein